MRWYFPRAKYRLNFIIFIQVNYYIIYLWFFSLNEYLEKIKTNIWQFTSTCKILLQLVYNGNATMNLHVKAASSPHPYIKISPSSLAEHLLYTSTKDDKFSTSQMYLWTYLHTLIFPPLFLKVGFGTRIVLSSI